MRRQILWVAMVLASFGASLMALPSPPAHAATLINCDTAPRNSADWRTCRQLVGTSSCAWNNGDGTWTIALGYRNPTDFDLYAAAPINGQGGGNNALRANGGFAENPGHITTFWADTTSTTAFTVTWTPTWWNPYVQWDLMGHQYTFSTTTQPLCASKPVPVSGNATAAWIGLGILVATFLGLNHRRLRALAVHSPSGTGRRSP
ncbi:MAG: hypothetical protein K6T28_06780 [Acidothermus sp.]|nr:hypothetical protein [Acidothermus sp.]